MKDTTKITLTYKQLKELISEAAKVDNYTDIVAKIISTIDGEMIDQAWLRVHNLRSADAAIRKIENGDYLDDPILWDKYGWLSSAKVKTDMGRTAIWKKLGVSDEKYAKRDITDTFDDTTYARNFEIEMEEGDLKKLNMKPFHIR